MSSTDKTWRKFPKSILDPLDKYSCRDAISGTCLKDLSVDECIDICKGHKDCDKGMHFEIGKHNICVPFRTNSYDEDINPSYTIKDQSTYKFGDNVNATYFQNIEKYPYPVMHSSQIYYTNTLTLNSYYKQSLGLVYDKDKDKDAKTKMSTNTHTNLTILPIFKLLFSMEWKPLKYGDRFYIMLPNTSIVLKTNKNGKKVSLVKDVSDFLVDQSEKPTTNLFYLEPSDKKKINEVVKLNEPFLIKTHQGGIVKMEDSGNLSVGNDNEDTLDNKEEIYFTFKSSMQYHYCEDNICKFKFDNKDLITDDTSVLKFKNSKNELVNLYANPQCWNSCGKEKINKLKTYENFKIFNHNHHRVFYTGIFFILLLFSVLIIFFIKKHNQKLKYN